MKTINNKLATYGVLCIMPACGIISSMQHACMACYYSILIWIPTYLFFHKKKKRKSLCSCGQS